MRAEQKHKWMDARAVIIIEIGKFILLNCTETRGKEKKSCRYNLTGLLAPRWVMMGTRFSFS